MRLFIIILITFSFFSCTGDKSKSASGKDAKPITVINPQTRTLNKWLELMGDIKGELEVDVYPEINEQILEIKIEIGDKVEKDQVLAILKKGTLDDGFKQALAGLEVTRVQLSAATTEYNRAMELHKEGIASNSQLTSAKAARDAAAAQVKQLQAQVSQSKTVKNKSVILAPIDGYIGQLNYDKGNMAIPTKALCTITQFDNIKITLTT